MKHQSLSISIPEPCNENWSIMTPEEKGRHCKSCQKTVIDFTRMPKVKIAEFVTEQKGSLCGRFSSDQLNVELIPPKPSKMWMKYAAIILGLVPALGYGQEATIPQKPIEEMRLPPITGDIILEERGEIKTRTNPVIQEIQISGIITDFDSKEILSEASIINYQAKKVQKKINVDKNGRFQTRIPAKSAILISSIGYQSKMVTNADLLVGKELQIALKKINNSPMGIIEMHPPIKMQKPYKGKIRLHSVDTTRIIEKEQEIQNIPSKVVETENQKVVDNESEPIPVNNESEEPLHYLFPTVEIVATNRIFLKGAMICGGTTTEKKENWFIRQLKKFKSWVIKSHEEAVKNRDIDEVTEITTLASDSRDINQHQKINKAIDENKTAKQEDTDTNDQEIIEINIYPNPSSGPFNIELPLHINKFFIEVTDVNNQLIMSKDNTQFDGMVDLSNYNSGSYIISIISEKQLITSKMVVKM